MLSQVTMKVTFGKEAREVWFFLETDHESLFDLNEDLVEDGTVFGERIDSERMPDGSRRETSRYEFILHRDSVVTISEPLATLHPPAGKGAAA